MEYTYRNKWLTIFMVILMLANMVTLVTFWLLRSNDSRPGMPPARGSAAATMIINELAFDKAQQEAYQKLIDEHQAEVRTLRQELGPLKDQFFNSVKDSSMYGEALKDAAAPLAEKEKQLDILTFIHFKKVRSLCRPGQKIKFDKIIARVLRAIAQPPQHRRPGPPPGGGKGMPLSPGEEGLGPPPPPPEQ